MSENNSNIEISSPKNPSSSSVEKKKSIIQIIADKSSCDDLNKVESDHEESIKEESVKEDCVKEDCVKEECVKEECVKEECVNEECVKEECVNEECVKEECVNEESVKKETPSLLESFVHNNIIQAKATPSETPTDTAQDEKKKTSFWKRIKNAFKCGKEEGKASEEVNEMITREDSNN